MAFTITQKLGTPKAGETRYCNCQKPGCFPCPGRGVAIGETEDGQLQLCRSCIEEYKNSESAD